MNLEPEITLIIATRNRHKVLEICAMVGARADCRSVVDFPGAPAVVEDGATFADNAIKKAVELAAWFRNGGAATEQTDAGQPRNWWVLADDSGLEVDALKGEPGVHSARYAAASEAHNASDDANNTKLLRLLAMVPWEQRTARFRCVIALCPVFEKIPSRSLAVCDELAKSVLRFEGTCEGRIGLAPCGKKGFGYDPLFIPEGYDLTFAELGDAIKNTISHRSRAIAGLQALLSDLQRGTLEVDSASACGKPKTP
jgi:XTP/dITP diphosphohydrolase